MWNKNNNNNNNNGAWVVVCSPWYLVLKGTRKGDFCYCNPCLVVFFDDLQVLWCHHAVLVMGVMPFVKGVFVFVLEGLVHPATLWMRLGKCINLLVSRVASQSDLLAESTVLSNRDISADLSSHVSLSSEASRFDSNVQLCTSTCVSTCSAVIQNPPTAGCNGCNDVDGLMCKAYGPLCCHLMVPLLVLHGFNGGTLSFIIGIVTICCLVALLARNMLNFLIRNCNILCLGPFQLSEWLCLVPLCYNMIIWWIKPVMSEDFLSVACSCGMMVILMFFYKRRFAVTKYSILAFILHLRIALIT